jgi:hypothetical protein
MNRIVAILMFLSLGAAACAHNPALDRGDVAAMRNDGPAISPWSEPIPGESMMEDRIPAREPSR